MIDFHCHILPQTDDGSSSIAESLQLLQMQKMQGIHLAVATPHFDAECESVESFLSRRARAAESLRSQMDESCPQMICGAEIRCFEGISRLKNVDTLQLGESGVLLMELPEQPWTKYLQRELTDMSGSGTSVLVAHMERALPYQTRQTMEFLLERGILFQSNASFFNDRRTQRKAMHLLNAGEIHVLGTDCHNIRFRPPNMETALQKIRKKLGAEILSEMDAFGQRLLQKNQ